MEPFTLLRILSNSIKKKLQNMVFIMDMEIVGDRKNIWEIVQIHMEDFLSKRVFMDNYVIPTLSNNFNSYYNRDKLIECGKNIEEIVDDIKTIWEDCEKPIFVTHNWTTSDEYLFQKNGIFLKRNEYKIVDTRHILSNYISKDKAQMEIWDIYEDIFGEIRDETRCEEQVYMLRRIMERCGITYDTLMMLGE